MRPSVYPERVVFHDSAAVVAALKEKADREQIAFAELLRGAARRDVEQVR